MMCEPPAGGRLAWRSPGDAAMATASFWVCHVLAAAAGVTVVDVLSDTARLGLTVTTVVVLTALAAAVPWRRGSEPWFTPRSLTLVVLTAAAGTLLADNLVDDVGVSHARAALVCAGALIATVLPWHAAENTISGAIGTGRRPWPHSLATLFAYALGAAASALVVDRFAWGPAVTVAGGALLLAAVVAGGRLLTGGARVVAFWTCCVLVVAVGASVGALLAEPADAGGADLGPAMTTLVFLAFGPVVAWWRGRGVSAPVRHGSEMHSRRPPTDRHLDRMRPITSEPSDSSPAA